MKTRTRVITVLTAVAVAAATLLSIPQPLPAFPNAKGYGTETIGGRGGEILFVTNTNDSGAGSLRAALEYSKPRIVIFKTGGIVTLSQPIIISSPFVTVAGQTAPAMGFVIKGAPIKIETHDVIIRGLKFRIGDDVGFDPENRDGLSISGWAGKPVYNVVLDHNSIAWAVDENGQMWDNTLTNQVHSITWSNNIFTEGLEYSIHPKGQHGMGLIVGEDAKYITLWGNLFANNGGRNPLIQGGTIVEAVNNVTYNWRYEGYQLDQNAKVDLIGNYIKKSSYSNSRNIGIECGFNGQIFNSDNFGGSFLYGCTSTVNIFSSSPVASSGQITAVSSSQAFINVLANAGSFPRDTIDLRAINTTKNGTSPVSNSQWLVNHPSDVGGWPVYPAGVAPADSDNDGLPDSFEVVDVLPNDYAPSGYTWIEEYINSFYSVPVTPSVTVTISTNTLVSPTASKTPTVSATVQNPPSLTPTASRTPAPTVARTSTPTATSAVCEVSTSASYIITVCKK